MSTPYPSTLPCVSRIEGHAAAAFAGAVRTPMEAGNTRQRRSQRVLPHQLQLVFVMPQTRLADWMTWVNLHAWDEWIEMKLPGLLASRHGHDVIATPVRFISDLQLRLRQEYRLWYWDVSVEAEWLPLSADLVALRWFVGGRPGTTPAVADWIVGGRPPTPSTPDTVTGGAPSNPSAIA